MAGFKGLRIDEDRLAVETDRMHEGMALRRERKHLEYWAHGRRFMRQVKWYLVLILLAWLFVQAAKTIGGTPATVLSGIGLALATTATVMIHIAIVQFLGRVCWSAWREFFGQEDDIEYVGSGRLAMARVSENVDAAMSDMVREALRFGDRLVQARQR